MTAPRPGARRLERPAWQTRAATAALVVLLVGCLALALGLGDLFGGSSADEEQADAARERTAVVAASTVLETWSRRDLDYDTWWAGLRPLLTPGGRQAYAHTDPAQVPELGTLELDAVDQHPGGGTATVWFTTSGGRFGVDLSRREAGGAWLANRVIFPGQESMFG